MVQGDITRLRVEYCFALAHLCACPPPVVGTLKVLDFARLIDGIEQYDAAVRSANQG